MARRRRRLGKILHKAGLVERWDLVNAINTSMRSDKWLGEILVERGQIDEETLAKFISHFKKCKSCWIKNRIPTDYSGHYFSCERCGSLIQIQPSVLALILWSVILLTALAVAI